MNDIGFMHYRVIDIDGNAMSTGGVTLAFTTVHEEVPRVVIGMARCSHRDVFCRKTGRAIAEGRLKAQLSNPSRDCNFVFETDLTDSDAPLKEVVHTAMQEIIDEVMFSR